MTVIAEGHRFDEQLVAETNAAGLRLTPGDYVDDLGEGVHPYGKPAACPFCRERQDWTTLWYNGPGSPPSYTFVCGSCGAQGPHSHGFERGDHWNARIDAVTQWNGYRPRRYPLRLCLRRRLGETLRYIGSWLEATS